MSLKVYIYNLLYNLTFLKLYVYICIIYFNYLQMEQQKWISDQLTGLEKILWWAVIITSLTSIASNYLLNKELKTIDAKIQNLDLIPEPTSEELKNLINEIRQITQKYVDK